MEGRSHSMKIDNRSFERVEEFKYLRTTLTNQNSIHGEIKSKLKSGNVCYHSVQNFLSFSLLSKNLKIKIYVVCLKSKCTVFLFKCLLDSPEITSYLLQSMTLGKLHSGSNVFFPLIIAVLEVIFCKCVWFIGYNFLYVFPRPEMMTLQLRFQLRGEVEIARS